MAEDEQEYMLYFNRAGYDSEFTTVIRIHADCPYNAAIRALNSFFNPADYSHCVVVCETRIWVFDCLNQPERITTQGGKKYSYSVQIHPFKSGTNKRILTWPPK